MKSTEYQLNTFLQYVRTKQFCLNALKGMSTDSYVHVPMYEIKTKYLVNPKEDIKSLMDTGRLAFKEDTTSKGHIIYFYKCLEAGYYDINLINHRGIELNNTTHRMMHHLKLVSLPTDAPRTHYFDAFLNHKELIRTFFNVDEFSGRIHTPVTSLKSEYRKNILLDGKETVSIDVVTMQPLLLGSILKSKIGENEYSKWIDEGEDIYIMLQSKAKLNSRDEAKKRFFEILFSRPNEQLSKLFGNSAWIEWINEFKQQPFELNPHTVEKNHSNLAWLLQNKEVEIMREVWSKLLEHGILFISVHDEVIVQLEQYDEATTIFKSVMDKYFDYYRLSDKQGNNVEEQLSDKAKSDTIKKTPQPKKGELYSINELKTKFQLSDEFINQNFDEFYHNIGWINI
jgi:hypothetical protein